MAWIFAATTIIFFVLWIVQKIMNAAFLYYIAKKYTLPEKGELEDCIKIIVEESVKKFFKKKPRS